MGNTVHGATVLDASPSGLVTMLQFGGGSTGDVISFTIDSNGTTTSGTIAGSIHDPASAGFAMILAKSLAAGYPVQLIDPDSLGAYAGVQWQASIIATPGIDLI